jgi:hypothetical protein
MQVNGPQVSATMAEKDRESVGVKRRGKIGLTDGDGTADTTLTLLDSQVGEEDAEDVLRTDGLGDVSERVDGSSSNRLLMRLEEVEELEANSHPLSGRDELGSSIGDTSNQVDGRLLYLLVSITENRGHSRDCEQGSINTSRR